MQTLILRRVLAGTVLVAAVTAATATPPGAHAASATTTVDIDVRAGLAIVPDRTGREPRHLGRCRLRRARPRARRFRRTRSRW